MSTTQLNIKKNIINASSKDERKARLIALYLPQFHPIPENNEWWGEGFTEWTNVGKAKPMFPGHYQPRIPKDLGYYDLRVSETRIAQAELARKNGIEGFCYWHYWFGNGKRLLERPFNEVLASGEPDFPFCLGWANQTWTGVWHGLRDRTLAKQLYPGVEDYTYHFNTVLKAFRDKRYITVDGRPLFIVYDMSDLKQPNEFTDCWRSLAQKAGLKGIYFVAVTPDPEWDHNKNGFDAAALDMASMGFRRLRQKSATLDFIERHTGIDLNYSFRKRFRVPRIYDYRKFIDYYCSLRLKENIRQYPNVIPNWDNTPRSGFEGIVFQNSSPELFRKNVSHAINLVKDRDFEHRLVFVKSWNEWAEGNYLEPDLKYGDAYLNIVREEVVNIDANKS